MGRHLRFNENRGTWYTEAATQIVRHLPHVLRDPSGAPGNFVARAFTQDVAEHGGRQRTYIAAGEVPLSGNSVEHDGRGGRQAPVRAGDEHLLGDGATSSDSDVAADSDSVTSTALAKVLAAGAIVFVHAGTQEQMIVDSSYRGRSVQVVADYGELKVFVLDPESRRRIGERPMFRSWLLDHDNRRVVDVDDQGRVRIGTAVVRLGASRSLRQVELRGTRPPAPTPLARSPCTSSATATSWRASRSPGRR